MIESVHRDYSRACGAVIAAGLLTLATSAQRPLLGRMHEMLPVTGIPSAGAAADVDGDGRLDALLLEPWATARLYHNDGDGVFSEALAAALDAAAWPTAVAVGDLDGDGDVDAILTTEPSQVLLNDGSGTFVLGSQLSPLYGSASCVALGDVDGDLDLDVLIGWEVDFSNGQPIQNRLYLNDGHGNFVDVSSTQFVNTAAPTSSVAFGDVDGDGDLDAVIGNSSRVSGLNLVNVANELFLNDGKGVFSPAPAGWMPALTDATWDVALGDVDGDGDPDLVVGNFDGQNRVHLNDGSGAFVDAPGRLSGNSRALLLADFDGDTDVDIRSDRALYRNDGSGTFADVSATRLPATPGVACVLGDADGDGDVDAFTSTGLELNDGTGRFFDVSRAMGAGIATLSRAIALGDLDGDGDLDAFVASRDGDRLMRNDGPGGFTDITSNLPAVAGANEQTTSVALGDVDGDNDLDVLIGVDRPGLVGGAINRLYRNNGNGVFTDVSNSLPQDSQATLAVALADMDGDNDLDAIIVNGFDGLTSGPSRLCLNDGSGAFSDVTAANWAVAASAGTSVAVGDVDGDHDLDVMLGKRVWPYQNKLYLNNGKSVLTDVTSSNMPAGLGAAAAVTLGDIDRDGDLDALIGGESGGNAYAQDRLYRNDGGGVFTDVTDLQWPVDLRTTTDVALVDLDGDGDLDAHAAGLPHRVYVNDGNGNFQPATSGQVAGELSSYSVAAGDLDRDGDVDAWVGTLYYDVGDVILANLTRHLTWRALPRAGKPLIFDLSGPPGATWTLFLSMSLASTPLSFGWFQLDPVSLVQGPTSAFDSQGQSTLRFPMPADPALVGITAFWQTLVWQPLGLSNAEATVFSGF